MSAAPPPENAALKDWFDEARHRQLARELAALSRGFEPRLFLRLCLEGLAGRSLMQRLHQCALAFHAAQSGSYRQKVALLKRLMPQIGHAFVAIFPCDFVASFGLEDFEFSMRALKFFTPFGSAEFAVRPFIAADQGRALAIMQQWADDPCEHVRRLASEGSRPRLPWGTRLNALVRDPRPCAALLDQLKDDPSEYVRRSVANHLNDISKDHPQWLLSFLGNWDLQQPSARWIARHACRSLIKQGDAGALKLLGFGASAKVEASLSLAPARLRLGEHLQLRVSLRSTSRQRQRLAVDYALEYARAGGRTSIKVFKWKELELAAGVELVLEKRQLIRDFSTRRHHGGRHRVEVQVNGQRLAQASFELLV